MFQSSLIHSFWAILTRKSMSCFILCNPPWHIFLSGFHSSSPVCQAASQHLRPRVHGHRVWVRGLRVTSSHCQMGQEWRCCHPQRLLQNNCMFIRNTCLSQPFSSWEWLKMLLVRLLTAGFFPPFLFCRRSTTCRFWVSSSQMRVSTSALRKTMLATSSPVPSSSS